MTDNNKTRLKAATATLAVIGYLISWEVNEKAAILMTVSVLGTMGVAGLYAMFYMVFE